MTGVPVFDYEGSLELARQMVQMSDDLASASSSRATDRDSALDAWQGEYGDDHRARASGEDGQVKTTVDELDQTADDWAAAWQRAVTDYNDAMYQQALDDQLTYDSNQVWAYLADANEAERNDLPAPSRYQPGSVSTPPAIAVPTLPSYTTFRPFASYRRVGDDLVIVMQAGPA